MMGVMQFGRSYEEFEVGATYKHWPGKTVTEFDDHMFCLLTMNHHPLHLDAHYAEETTQFGRNVVVGNYVYSILLGMSVPDISGKAIANLEIESLRHVAPTFHGDTLYGETTVLDKWESKSKDDRGVVHVETIGYNQDGKVVCIFRRKVMVPKDSYLEERGGEQPGRPVPQPDKNWPGPEGQCRARPSEPLARPPRRDRVERLRTAHVHDRHRPHRGRRRGRRTTPAGAGRGDVRARADQSTAPRPAHRRARRVRGRGRRRPRRVGLRRLRGPDHRRDPRERARTGRSGRIPARAGRRPSRSPSGSTGSSRACVRSTATPWCSPTATRCPRSPPAGSTSRSRKVGCSGSAPPPRPCSATTARRP